MRRNALMQLLAANRQPYRAPEARIVRAAVGDEATVYFYDAIVGDRATAEWVGGVCGVPRAAQTLLPFGGQWRDSLCHPFEVWLAPEHGRITRIRRAESSAPGARSAAGGLLLLLHSGRPKPAAVE